MTRRYGDTRPDRVRAPWFVGPGGIRIGHGVVQFCVGVTMPGAQGTGTRVVVVCHDDAGTITDCLDGVAAQGAGRVDVVVVDLGSTDGAADLAIRHPIVGRVAVTTPGDADRVIGIGADGAADGRILVLDAAWRPEPGWLDAALDALGPHGFVHGPGRTGWNFGIDRGRLGHLALGTEPVDACARVRAAGSSVGLAPGMRVERARHVPDPTALPTSSPPGPPPGVPTGTVSVVLCTRNRPEHLARCLASLARLDDPDHEIVVVDNHDRRVVQAADLPPRARLVHEPRSGLDHARNRGLVEAAGEIVAYVDDDCEVDPHWLTGIRAGFADPEVRVVTGRVRPASLATPSQRWFEAHFSFDRGAHRDRFTPWDRRAWYPMWPGAIGAGCNMAFRRDALLDVGGFDELLDMGTRIGGGGDLDVLIRFLDRGAIIAYQPDALVWHHHRAAERDVTRQFFGYGTAVGALVTKAVLERPGRRFVAARFFLDRIRVGVRLVRLSRAGAHALPVRLVLVDLLGQLAGPPTYLAMRAAARRAP